MQTRLFTKGGLQMKRKSVYRIWTVATRHFDRLPVY